MKNSWFCSWFVALVALGALCCGVACKRTYNQGSDALEAWDQYNIPSLFGENYVTEIDKLPREGMSGTIPWSDTYWPATEGGIAARWNGPKTDAFTYATITLEQAKKMGPAELASLSPVEKYELFIGDYDHKFVSWERQRASLSKGSWEGICHGWASASLQFREPNPVVIRGAHGIDIPFGASDIKALLSYYQAVIHRGRDVPKKALGRRCSLDFAEVDVTSKSFRYSPSEDAVKCRDVNAGSFHVVIANEIGLRKQGFVVDVTPDAEVWNQPVFAYRSEVKKPWLRRVDKNAAPGTVRELDVRTTIRYGKETEPQWENLTTIDGNATEELTYDYVLELNAKGEIIGGRWKNPARLPDYLALHPKPTDFNGKTGYWSKIQDIYAASLEVREKILNPVER